jgi:prephenate dehydrogenase
VAQVAGIGTNFISGALGFGRAKARREEPIVGFGSGGEPAPRVAIIGTGLIGASIGLGIKARGPAGLLVVGAEIFRDHAQAAVRMKAVDATEASAARAVEGASLVIIATPILSIRQVFEEIAPVLLPGAVVTDTGSTKAEIQRWAAMLLPANVAFVGGHPMAGKTESGPTAADATLFDGARWVVVPPRHATPDAVDVVVGLAQLLGAKPQFMDAEEHDAYVAAISHVPLMAATALFQMARSSEAWPELSLLAASGFRDTTRLAGTEPSMAHDIAITNREQIVHWMRRYREALQRLEDGIRNPEGEAELFRVLSTTNLDYTAFREGVVGRREVDQQQMTDIPDVGMADLLLGSALADRARELQQRSEDRLEDAERDFRARGRQ